MIWTNTFWLWLFGFDAYCFIAIYSSKWIWIETNKAFSGQKLSDWLLLSTLYWPMSLMSSYLKLVMINQYFIAQRVSGKCFSKAHNKDFHIIHLIKFNFECEGDSGQRDGSTNSWDKKNLEKLDNNFKITSNKAKSKKALNLFLFFFHLVKKLILLMKKLPDFFFPFYQPLNST